MFLELAVIAFVTCVVWFTAPLTARLYALPARGGDRHSARVRELTRLTRQLTLFLSAAIALIAVMMRVFPAR